MPNQNQNTIITREFYNMYSDPYQFFQEWVGGNGYDIDSINLDVLHELLDGRYSDECDSFFSENLDLIDCEINNNPPF